MTPTPTPLDYRIADIAAKVLVVLAMGLILWYLGMVVYMSRPAKVAKAATPPAQTLPPAPKVGSITHDKLNRGCIWYSDGTSVCGNDYFDPKRDR